MNAGFEAPNLLDSVKWFLMKKTGHLLFLFVLSGLFRPALAIDLQPGDIVAPPPNITAVTISYINSQNNDLFRNGVNTGADPKLESNSVFISILF